jgi:O-antigen/teichoic acid export membrane protein
MSKADFGAYGLIMAFAQVFAVICVLSLQTGNMRFHYDYNTDEQKKMWSSVFIFVVITSVSFVIFMLIFKDYIAMIVLKNNMYNKTMFYGILIAGLLGLYNFIQSYFKTVQDGKKSGFLDLLFVCFFVTIALLAVILFKKRVYGLLAAYLLAYLLVIIIASVFFIKKNHLFFDWMYIKQMVLYSLPFVFHSISSNIITLIDRFLINNMMNISYSGSYTLAVQLSNVAIMIYISVNQAYGPWFFKTYLKQNDSQSVEAVSKKLLYVYSFIALLLCLFAYEGMYLLTAGMYTDSWQVLIFLAPAGLANAYYLIYVGPIFLEKQWLVPLISVFVAVENIILNIFFIKVYGILGAAIASFIALFSMQFIVFLISRKISNIKYEFKLPNMFLFLICGIGLLINVIDLSWIYLFIIKIVISCICIIILKRHLKIQIMDFFRQLQKRKRLE